MLGFGVLVWRWGNIPCQIEQICRQRYCGWAEPASCRFPLSVPSIPSPLPAVRNPDGSCASCCGELRNSSRLKLKCCSCTFHFHQASTFSELGWDSSRLHSCPVIPSHKTGCHFLWVNRSSIDPFTLFPKLWVICFWIWYRSCAAANEKLRFVSYDEMVLLCCSIFLSAEVNQNATFIGYLSLGSAWEWVWNSSCCSWFFWAKGKVVGKIVVAATHWHLFRCIKPFCLSSDGAPVSSLGHHVVVSQWRKGGWAHHLGRVEM